MKKINFLGICVVLVAGIILGIFYVQTTRSAQANAQRVTSETVDCCAE